MSPGFASAGANSVVNLSDFGKIRGRLSATAGFGPSAFGASSTTAETSRARGRPSSRRDEGAPGSATVTVAGGRVHWPGKEQFWSEQSM